MRDEKSLESAGEGGMLEEMARSRQDANFEKWRRQGALMSQMAQTARLHNPPRSLVGSALARSAEVLTIKKKASPRDTPHGSLALAAALHVARSAEVLTGGDKSPCRENRHSRVSQQCERVLLLLAGKTTKNVKS